MNSADQLMTYYQQHYDRYNLGNYNVPLIHDDILVDHKMPDDREEVEDDHSFVITGGVPESDSVEVSHTILVTK